MINKVAVLVRRPVGDERATLGLRTAYATQVGGYPTSLVLLEDGGLLPGGRLARIRPEHDQHVPGERGPAGLFQGKPGGQRDRPRGAFHPGGWRSWTKTAWPNWPRTRTA